MGDHFGLPIWVCRFWGSPPKTMVFLWFPLKTAKQGVPSRPWKCTDPGSNFPPQGWEGTSSIVSFQRGNQKQTVSLQGFQNTSPKKQYTPKTGVSEGVPFFGLKVSIGSPLLLCVSLLWGAKRQPSFWGNSPKNRRHTHSGHDLVRQWSWAGAPSTTPPTGTAPPAAWSASTTRLGVAAKISGL